MAFKKIDSHEVVDYHGVGTLYEHEKTGMQVFCIKNSDNELFAGYMFRTPSTSNCGVAHIIEHSVLSGSKKYPVKDPFMLLSTGSANTFMNAITYPGHTFYPFASVVKKDFDNIFNVYTDAVFDPLLRKQTFYQEGIRQTDGRFDGVVFNEMKGHYADQEAIVGHFAQVGLFEGTNYGFDSGGRPESICELSYDEYVAMYKKWYHPSNCLLFLYGDLDAEPYLDYLEQNYLYKYERGQRLDYDRFVRAKSPWSKEIVGPNESSSSVLLSWATQKESSPLDFITLSVLVDILLGDPGNPLYRAITESPLGEDLHEQSGMGGGFDYLPFIVGFSGAKREDAKKIEAFLIKALQKIVHKGLDPLLIQASIKAEEFTLQEVQRHYYPIGFEAASRLMPAWRDDSSLFEAIETSSRIKALKEALLQNPRHFEDWIQKNLIDNPHRLLLTVYPDENYEANIQKKIDANLKAQDDCDSEYLRVFNNTPDTPEALASVPHLGREDLTDKLLDVSYQEVLLDGQKAYLQRVFTNGICYYSFNFDTSDLNEEEHLLMPLLLRLLWSTGVGDMDYSEVGLKLKMLTGSSYIVPSCSSSLNENIVSGAVLMLKTLAEDSEEALKFVSLIIREGHLDDLKRIYSSLVDVRSGIKSSFIDNAQSYALRRATMNYSPAMKEQELISGISQWEYLHSLKKADMPLISKKLIALRKKVFVKQKLTSQVLCDAELMDDSTKDVSAFVQSFENAKEPFEINKDFYFIDKSKKQEVEVFTINGQVAFNALASSPYVESEDIRAQRIVLSALLCDHGLWEAIRSKGGAYMVDLRQGLYSDSFMFSTYRDPRINQSYEDLLLQLELLAEGANEAEVEAEIISLIGREMRPRNPMDLLNSARNRIYMGLSKAIYEQRIESIKRITATDIQNQARQLLLDIKKDNAKVIIAPKALLKANSIKQKPKKLWF